MANQPYALVFELFRIAFILVYWCNTRCDPYIVASLCFRSSRYHLCV